MIKDTNKYEFEKKTIFKSKINEIPADIMNCLQKIGISSLRNIQNQSIEKGILNLNSFLVVAPSGSGKTLIGEIAAINSIITNFKKAIYLVPLRSLANEKVNYFSKVYSPLKLKIIMVVGDMDIPKTELEEADLIISTYEKFDSFLRSEHYNFLQISVGTIIIDEIHNIGSNARGIRLENLILSIYHFENAPQIIGLSATIANVALLKDWLEFLETNFRKRNIQLIEESNRPIKLDYQILKTHNKLLTLKKIISSITKNKGKILVFTNSRKKTIRIAEDLIKLNINANKNIKMNSKENKLRIGNLFDTYPNLLTKNMKELVLEGLCYHHAGLHKDQKEMIETLFKNDIIKVLFTTTTLSTGVNLPARSVVLHDFCVFDLKKSKRNNQSLDKGISIDFHFKEKFIKKPLPKNLFHQICGRAGRPGLDPNGSVYILVNELEQRQWVIDNYFEESNENENSILLKPKFDDVCSRLCNDVDLFYEVVLNIINKSNNPNIREIYKYLKYSLYNFERMKLGFPIQTLFYIHKIEISTLLRYFKIKKIDELLETADISIQFNTYDNENLIGTIDYHFNDFSIVKKKDAVEKAFARLTPIKFSFSIVRGFRCECKNLKHVVFKIMTHGGIMDHKMQYCFDLLSILYSIEFYKGNKSIKFDYTSLGNDFNIIKIKSLIVESLFGKSIIDDLLDINLIYNSVGKTYGSNLLECSPIGKISLNYYINPKSSLLVDNYLKFLEKNQKIIELPDIIKIIKVVLLEKNIRNSDFIEIIIPIMLGNQNMSQIVDQLKKIHTKHKIYESDLVRLIEEIIRGIKFLYNLIEKLYPHQISSKLTRLYHNANSYQIF